MGFKAEPPIYVGDCELCGDQHVGIYYIRDSWSREPMWVCQSCEKVQARLRDKRPRLSAGR